MSNSIPKRLRREPLIEAIWQVRFEPGQNALGDVLVGVIYSALTKTGGTWQVTRLPPAELPPFITDQDPTLRYAAKHRIECHGEPILYQVGDRIVTLNCRRPYVGWLVFKAKILELQRILEESGLIAHPSHQALRYLDLVERADMPDLTGLRLQLQIGDHAIHDQPTQLRVEIRDDAMVHILQIITPAEIQASDGKHQGTLIDLETVLPLSDGWATVSGQIDRLHEASKLMFFQQVLTPETTKRLGPEY